MANLKWVVIVIFLRVWHQSLETHSNIKLTFSSVIKSHVSQSTHHLSAWLSLKHWYHSYTLNLDIFELSYTFLSICKICRCFMQTLATFYVTSCSWTYFFCITEQSWPTTGKNVCVHSWIKWHEQNYLKDRGMVECISNGVTLKMCFWYHKWLQSPNFLILLHNVWKFKESRKHSSRERK